MPYKFIGRTTELYGKTLWEIVGNLKDFGVGRIFVRNRFERYPEKSWFKILQVDTHDAPKDVPLYAYEKPRFVSIKCEKYWRGQKLSEPIYITGGSYKPDYRLIPKVEEAEYCQVVEAKEKKEPLSQTFDFPPLLREIIQREKGSTPKLQMLYKRSEYNRIPDPVGHKSIKPENPNAQLGTPVSPRLFENVLE